jgi:hypothetical protein
MREDKDLREPLYGFSIGNDCGSLSVTGTTSSDDVAQAQKTRPPRDLHTDFV